MSKKIIVFDTTLRDGEQAPGATMLLKEKIAIARLLENMGVDVIEAGFAAASHGDMQCIDAVSRIVKNATVCSLARASKNDIEAAAHSLKKAKNPRIHTFIATSDIHIQHQLRMTHQQVLETIDEAVRYARSFCDDIEWSAADATRSNINFLIQAVRTAVNAGAKTINLPDTVGYTYTEEYKHIVAILCKAFPDTIFSVHCHNDLGLATANSLAGILGGARQIECTINGIGERAGNAAMEEVVMAIKTRSDIFRCYTNIDTSQIYTVSKLVSNITGFYIQKNKAIVGANAFIHESGIHQDGMLKSRDTYEIISPETVGVTKTQIVLGKHSGRAAMKNKVKALGFDLTDVEILSVLKIFKTLCDNKKYITENDLLLIIKNHQTKMVAPTHSIQFISLDMHYHDIRSCTASIAVRVFDKEMVLQGQGNSALEAIFRSINKIIPDNKLQLIDLESHGMITKENVQFEASVILRYNDKDYIGNARNIDNIQAVVCAYLSVINQIII